MIYSLFLKTNPPSVVKMIVDVLNKLSVIRSRSKILQEKLSSYQTLNSETLMTLNRKDIENVFDKTNPKMAEITTDSDGIEVFPSGGNRFKKTLKK